jgi:hypothetical protein
MSKWKFVLFIIIALIFGYFTHNSWNGILLFLFILLFNGILNIVKETQKPI